MAGAMGPPAVAVLTFLASALCFLVAVAAAEAMVSLVGTALRRRRLRRALPRDWWTSFQRELEEYANAEARLAREAEQRR